MADLFTRNNSWQDDIPMIRQEMAKELIDSKLYWPRKRLFAGVYKITIYN